MFQLLALILTCVSVVSFVKFVITDSTFLAKLSPSLCDYINKVRLNDVLASHFMQYKTLSI